MARPKVLLDACVLIPMPLADTLLRIAHGPKLFVPLWSDRILEEAGRNLIQHFGLTPEKLMHREHELRRHFPEASVEGYEHRIALMTNHPKDRHVLAAAVHAKAKQIVTYNLKDFPAESLEPYGIAAISPGNFLRHAHQQHPRDVLRSLESQASAIRQPLTYLLQRLSVNVPGFVRDLQLPFE